MAFKIRQWIKMISQHVLFPFVYFLNRWRKIDQRLVVFADAHHESCPEHMKLLAKKMQKENYRVRFFFFDEKRCGSVRAYWKMLSFMKLYASCRAVIICDNFLPVSSCRKKKATKVIQLWHGCGIFKRFGYDSSEDIPDGYLGWVYRNYDLVTVSGEKCVPYFERAMKLPAEKGVVRAVGNSITDRIYSTSYQRSCRERFLKDHPMAAGKKVVLWAPTFRGNAARAELSGEEWIDRLTKDERISEEFYLIKSLHPHLGRKDANQSTEELIFSADLLITDYSSVFFEYLLFDRPIVFFASDYVDYVRERSFYLNYETLPGIVVKDGLASDMRTKEQKDALYERLVLAVRNADGKEFEIKRERFRREYMEKCDGKATQRILRYIGEDAERKTHAKQKNE